MWDLTHDLFITKCAAGFCCRWSSMWPMWSSMWQTSLAGVCGYSHVICSGSLLHATNYLWHTIVNRHIPYNSIFGNSSVLHNVVMNVTNNIDSLIFHLNNIFVLSFQLPDCTTKLCGSLFLKSWNAARYHCSAHYGQVQRKGQQLPLWNILEYF